MIKKFFKILTSKPNALVPLDLCTSLECSWQNQDIPQKQYELFVRKELQLFKEGKKVPFFDALVTILKKNTSILSSSLLEIGCSSGYYNEVLKLRNLPFNYRGCDYSSSFLELAKKLYPSTPFDLEDASKLSYRDRSFDVVVSGCCILHVKEYRKAIAEAARVAKEYVVFHRTPVISRGSTYTFIKKAYGVEMFETHFSEEELYTLFAEQKLQIVDTITIHKEYSFFRRNKESCKTYLCKKT